MTGRMTHPHVQLQPARLAVALLACLSLVAQGGAQEAPLTQLHRAYSVYDRGRHSEALPLFRALAEKGDVEAAYMVGLMHHRGRGTQVDGQAAAVWYERAATANLPAALTNLGVLFRDGDGRELAPDPGRAIGYLRRAAYLEDPAGQLALAAMLVNGAASRQDLLEGIAFMRIAADAGDPIAKENLARAEYDAATSRAADEVRKEIEANILRLRELVRRERESARGGAGTRDQAPPAQPAASLHMRRVAIHDPMTDGCEAMVMLAPRGWEFQGTVEWYQDQSVLANPVWRLVDPSTGASLQSLPYRQFTWSPGGVLAPGQNHMGMTVMEPIRDPAAFVRFFWMGAALPHLQRARQLEIKELPALAALARRDWGANAECGAWRIRYEFQHEGAPWHEDVTFALLISELQPTAWHVTRCHTARGPAGSLDRLAPTLNTVVASASMTPRWLASWQVCHGLLVRQAQQVRIHAQRLAETLAANRDHLARMQQDIERTRAESIAAQNQAIREALGGVETWNDPYLGRTIELPQGYPNAWVNASGEYILSERPDFDPNQGSTVEWKSMQRVDPLGERTGR
jgi:TPR repeat protein